MIRMNLRDVKNQQNPRDNPMTVVMDDPAFTITIELTGRPAGQVYIERQVPGQASPIVAEAEVDLDPIFQVGVNKVEVRDLVFDPPVSMLLPRRIRRRNEVLDLSSRLSASKFKRRDLKIRVPGSSSKVPPGSATASNRYDRSAAPSPSPNVPPASQGSSNVIQISSGGQTPTRALAGGVQGAQNAPVAGGSGQTRPALSTQDPKAAPKPDLSGIPYLQVPGQGTYKTLQGSAGSASQSTAPQDQLILKELIMTYSKFRGKDSIVYRASVEDNRHGSPIRTSMSQGEFFTALLDIDGGVSTVSMRMKYDAITLRVELGGANAGRVVCERRLQDGRTTVAGLQIDVTPLRQKPRKVEVKDLVFGQETGLVV
ncbi:Hypothetical protein D9617_15g042990 [Elsinoe fawcettii]|nr:Hypothetical protein D9617_15g042990 [Elsinoe fawcettii]